MLPLKSGVNLLFIGDIFGSSGRRIIADHLDDITGTNHIDLVIANGAGLVFVAGDAADLALRVESAWEQPQLTARMGAAARRAWDRPEFRTRAAVT